MPVVLRWILFDQSSTSGTAYIFANAKMAAVVLTAAPLVVLYFFVQRFLTGGALLGPSRNRGIRNIRVGRSVRRQI